MNAVNREPSGEAEVEKVRERGEPASKDEKKDVRQQILDAARELFFTEGYENVSMRKVAEKISYSPTTIYLHFRDKADLFNCLCEEMYDQLSDLPRALEELKDRPLEYLRRVLHGYVEWGLAHPNQYRVAFVLSSKTSMTADDFLPEDSAALQAYNLCRGAVEACIRTGVFREVDVDAACQALWSAIHGLTSLLILFPTFPWTQRSELVELTVETMIRGLCSQSPEMIRGLCSQSPEMIRGLRSQSPESSETG